MLNGHNRLLDPTGRPLAVVGSPVASAGSRPTPLVPVEFIKGELAKSPDGELGLILAFNTPTGPTAIAMTIDHAIKIAQGILAIAGKVMAGPGSETPPATADTDAGTGRTPTPHTSPSGT